MEIMEFGSDGGGGLYEADPRRRRKRRRENRKRKRSKLNSVNPNEENDELE